MNVAISKGIPRAELDIYSSLDKGVCDDSDLEQQYKEDKIHFIVPRAGKKRFTLRMHALILSAHVYCTISASFQTLVFIGRT